MARFRLEKFCLMQAELGKDKPGAPDGLKVDVFGNLFAAGPNGLFIFAPDGTLLGRFELGTATGNCAWGEDGSTLFITSNTMVYRIRLRTRGAARLCKPDKNLATKKHKRHKRVALELT